MISLAFALLGCGTMRQVDTPEISRTVITNKEIGEPSSGTPEPVVSAPEQDDRPQRRGQIGSSRVPVLSGGPANEFDEDYSAAPDFGVETVDAFVPPLALPAFIDVVFGEMLEVPYVTGQGVAGRSDIVQLRSSGTISSDDFFSLVQVALEDFGVRITVQDNVYRIVEDEALKAQMPRFVRSRARRDTPGGLRPVVQFVELKALGANNMVTILRQAFGDRNDDLRFDANPAANYVVLSGLPDDVDAALSIIDQMDELQYAGTEILRYTPDFWDVTTLSNELNAVLTAEGWQTSTTAAAPRTILMVPVEFSNTLFIFTRSSDAAVRARHWLYELDRPASTGDVPQLYVYDVRNVDATQLANTVNSVLAGGAAGFGRGANPHTATGNSSNGQSGVDISRGSSIVVDPMGNRLIFSGTSSDYERLLPLLRQLDTPAAEVLIEVTIAEITLSDTTRFGVEWTLDLLDDGDGVTVQQQGIGLGTGGLDFGIITGDVNAALNAFAQNTQINVISRPNLVARSGGAAQIQVGTDVPIITSQRAANAQDGTGGTDVLQSVEYRSTGVLLSIEPIVFGNNRIDLDISQEVSTALATTTADIASPTISNRNITTALSLEDGSTAVIGGLIRDNYTRSNTGIPFLKDLPKIGPAFSSREVSVDRTELVVLITAYVLNRKEEKEALAREFSDKIDRSLRNDNNLRTVAPPGFE